MFFSFPQCPLIIDPAGRAVPAGLGATLIGSWVLVRAWIRFAMSSSTLLPLTVTIPLQWAKVLRLPRQRLNIKGVVSWSMIDEKRALCVRIRFFVDKDCTFAQRGVVLVYIAVLPLLCGQSPRRAEICCGSTDAVPGQVVDMPVIVLTVVQMCRKLWKRPTDAAPGRCCW